MYSKDLQMKLDNANVKMMKIELSKADSFIERDFLGEQ